MDEVCATSADCDGGQLCLPTGKCGSPSSASGACLADVDCGTGFSCEDGNCVLGQRAGDASAGVGGVEVAGAAASAPSSQAGAGGATGESWGLVCPSDMVVVADAFCIDRFEASRADATDLTAGSDSSQAVSQQGVIPWLVNSNEEAQGACEAVGKSLCTSAQWLLACEGPDGWEYAYGDEYDAAICNGIDTYGRTGYHLEPTGAFSECVSVWGAFDLNGNVWEHVLGGNASLVRGGAFNCSDSLTYHRCDYIPTYWAPSALGFRCCAEGA